MLVLLFFLVKSSSAAAKLSNGGKSLEKKSAFFDDSHRKGDWKCQKCDERNRKERFKCYCGTPKPYSFEEYQDMANLIVNYMKSKPNDVHCKIDIIDWCIREGLDCENDSQVKIEIWLRLENIF